MSSSPSCRASWSPSDSAPHESRDWTAAMSRVLTAWMIGGTSPPSSRLAPDLASMCMRSSMVCSCCSRFCSVRGNAGWGSMA